MEDKIEKISQKIKQKDTKMLGVSNLRQVTESRNNERKTMT